MTPTLERRAFRRLPALANRTSLEWWDGPATRSAPARLVNISPGGAFMAVDHPPPIGQLVWIRLEAPAATAWVGGRVIHGRSDAFGISFVERCPSDFLEAAVQGIAFGNILGGDEPPRG